MSVFVEDSFVDTDGTLAPPHAGGTGAAWTTLTGGWAAFQVQSNRIFAPGTFCWIWASATPPTAEYEVVADLTWMDMAGASVWVCGRQDTAAQTCYAINATPQTATTARLYLVKIVAGAQTVIGPALGYDFPCNAGDSHRVTLRIENGKKTVLLEGAEVMSSTDNAITAAGKVAVKADVASTSTTGVHVDSILGQEILQQEARNPIRGMMRSRGTGRARALSLIDRARVTNVDVVAPSTTPVDGDPLDLVWDVAAAADGVPLDLVWDLVAQVNGIALDLVWDARAQADGIALDLVWDTRAQADGIALDLLWDLVAQTNGVALDLLWDLRASVDGAILELIWDLATDAAPGAVDGFALDLVWDLVSQVDGDVLDTKWDLAAAVDRALMLLWDVAGDAVPPPPMSGGGGFAPAPVHEVEARPLRLRWGSVVSRTAGRGALVESARTEVTEAEEALPLPARPMPAPPKRPVRRLKPRERSAVDAAGLRVVWAVRGAVEAGARLAWASTDDAFELARLRGELAERVEELKRLTAELAAVRDELAAAVMAVGESRAEADRVRETSGAQLEGTRARIGELEDDVEALELLLSES